MNFMRARRFFTLYTLSPKYHDLKERHLHNSLSKILYAIADDLSVIEQKNCALVCQEWHAVFRHILYRAIKADTPNKFEAFLSTLQFVAISGEDSGLLVQQLAGQDG